MAVTDYGRAIAAIMLNGNYLNFCCNNEQGFINQTRERADVDKD